MPISRYNAKQPYFDELFLIANLKSYSTDLIPDFTTIYQLQLDRFQGFFFDDKLEEFQARINELSKIDVKLVNLVRVYLVSQLDMVLFAMYNPEACVLAHIKSVLDMEGVKPSHPDFINPNYISTLFIFEGSRLTFRCDVSMRNAIEIPIAFSKENLLNAGAFRDSWYGAPRRRAKHEKFLNDSG